MSTLGPDMLLYRAAAAHNLPVMCHAIAIGADKNWKNPNDSGRTCLFQAILSVRLIQYFLCIYNIFMMYYFIILYIINSFIIPRVL